MSELKDLQYYLNFLSKAPNFILEKKITILPNEKDSIYLNAIIKDLYFKFGLSIEDWNSIDFQIDLQKNENYARVILLASYFLSDKSFGSEIKLEKVKKLIFDLEPISEIVPIKDFLFDMERKEEFVRICFSSLDLILKNETKEKFQDRFKSIDSIERKFMFEESKKARERARILREEMARKEAEEAASKMDRE